MTLADARLAPGPPTHNVPLLHTADGGALWSDAAAAQRAPLLQAYVPKPSPPAVGHPASACQRQVLNGAGATPTEAAFAHLPDMGDPRITLLDARDMLHVVPTPSPGPSGPLTQQHPNGDWYAAQGFRQNVTATVDPLALSPLSVHTSAARELQDAQTLHRHYMRMGPIARDIGGRLAPLTGAAEGVGPRPTAIFGNTRPYTTNDVTATYGGPGWR